MRCIKYPRSSHTRYGYRPTHLNHCHTPGRCATLWSSGLCGLCVCDRWCVMHMHCVVSIADQNHWRIHMIDERQPTLYRPGLAWTPGSLCGTGGRAAMAAATLADDQITIRCAPTHCPVPATIKARASQPSRRFEPMVSEQAASGKRQAASGKRQAASGVCASRSDARGDTDAREAA
jgi:hypothetical protein